MPSAGKLWKLNGQSQKQNKCIKWSVAWHLTARACLADLFSSKNNTTHCNLRGSSTSLQLLLPKTECLKKVFAIVEQNCGTRFRYYVNPKTFLSLIIELMHTLFSDFIKLLRI